MSNYNVLVSAGGYATRFGSNTAKSLIYVNGVSLLERTLQSVIAGTLSPRIFVLTNRPEHTESYREICDRYDECFLSFDPGYSSTIRLVVENLPILADRFCFLYGHAPPSSDHISKIWELNAEVVGSAYPKSSRKDPIFSQSKYLEPPFLISKELFISDRIKSWSCLFSLYSRKATILETFFEPEFNNREEFQRYIERSSEYIS